MLHEKHFAQADLHSDFSNFRKNTGFSTSVIQSDTYEEEVNVLKTSNVIRNLKINFVLPLWSQTQGIRIKTGTGPTVTTAQAGGHEKKIEHEGKKLE